jgi:hypothetical protein
MSSDTTPRERFKQAAEAAIRVNRRNIDDRGVTGPNSALMIGSNPSHPGLLDVLADAAEQAYGDARPSGRRGAKENA